MKKSYWLLVIFNLIYIIGFALYYILRNNYEFLAYIGVLVLLFGFVALIQKKVRFEPLVLWMLSIWGLLHMMGGGVRMSNGLVLYRWVVFELFSSSSVSEFVILKFDQVLHFYIYLVMSLVLAHLAISGIRKGIKPSHFYLFIALASMGIGVVNELVEFGIVLVLKNSGVGGYYNTLLDLCFNTAGAIAGAGIDYIFRKSKEL